MAYLRSSGRSPEVRNPPEAEAGDPPPTTQFGSSRYASLPALFGLTALAQQLFFGVSWRPIAPSMPSRSRVTPSKNSVRTHDRFLENRGATLDVAFLWRLARSGRHGGNGAPRAGGDRPRSPHRRLSRSASSVPEVLRSRPAGRRLDPVVWGPFRY